MPRRAAMGSMLLTLLLVLLPMLVAPAAAADDVLFGEPRASGSFDGPVTFSTSFSSAAPPLRVELLTQRPGESSETVEIASVERVAGDAWQAAAYLGGHIVPNTRWDYRFRVVTEDGDSTGPAASFRYADDRFDWQVLHGDHVDVWWYEGSDDFGRRALEIAEAALASSSELLGVSQMEPVDFYIYSDKRAFREAMGPATRENVGGQAHPTIRTLFGLIEAQQIDSDWIEELITHELAHIVFHEAVDNPYQYPPRWLNEGLAVYVSRGYAEGDRSLVRGAAGGGSIMPLGGLGGNFPTRTTRSLLAYAESVAAVDYFIQTYGERQLLDLITSFADGSGLDKAFVAATGDDFAAFDAAWLASLGAEPPEAYGPRDVEPGPVPDAWAVRVGALLG